MSRLRADWTFNENRGGGYCGGTIKGIISDLAERVFGRRKSSFGSLRKLKLPWFEGPHPWGVILFSGTATTSTCAWRCMHFSKSIFFVSVESRSPDMQSRSWKLHPRWSKIIEASWCLRIDQLMLWMVVTTLNIPGPPKGFSKWSSINSSKISETFLHLSSFNTSQKWSLEKSLRYIYIYNTSQIIHLSMVLVGMCINPSHQPGDEASWSIFKAWATWYHDVGALASGVIYHQDTSIWNHDTVYLNITMS